MKYDIRGNKKKYEKKLWQEVRKKKIGKDRKKKEGQNENA